LNTFVNRPKRTHELPLRTATAIGALVLILLTGAGAVQAQSIHAGDPNYKGGFGFTAGFYPTGRLEASIVDSIANLDLASNYSMGVFFDFPITEQILIGPRLDFVGFKVEKIHGPNIDYRDVSDSANTQTLLSLSVSAKYVFRPASTGWALRPGVSVGMGFLSDLKVTDFDSQGVGFTRQILDNSQYLTFSAGLEAVWYLAPRVGLMADLRWFSLPSGGDDLLDVKTTEGLYLIRAGIVF
jgi:hypothetical protein